MFNNKNIEKILKICYNYDNVNSVHLYQEESIMIDTKHYEIVEDIGYTNKHDAYSQIKQCYEGIKGMTAVFDEGEWYIVKSKMLAES